MFVKQLQGAFAGRNRVGSLPSFPSLSAADHIQASHLVGNLKICVIYLPGGYLKSNVPVLCECVQATSVPKCVIWLV